MAKLLFKLNGVPDDEATEIRVLLEENNVDFYETDQGNWGISLAAIWLRDESEFDRAKKLIDAYQEERFRRARDEYNERRERGEIETLLGRAVRHPLRFLIYLIAIIAVLYLSLIPFIRLAD